MRENEDFIDIENDTADSSSQTDTEAEEKKSGASVSVFEWVQSMMNAIVIVILLLTFVFRLINVDGESMLPTLLDGDKVIITNFDRDYNYGDIVVISRGAKLDKVLIKRVIGLPGETRQMMLDSCKLINALPIRSVKFHQLQIVKGTRMEKEYAEHPQDFERFSLEDYLDFFVDMLERLRPDLFIERFVGEVPPRFVNETPWGLIRNVELLRLLEKRLQERDSWQGKLL